MDPKISGKEKGVSIQWLPRGKTANGLQEGIKKHKNYNYRVKNHELYF